MSRTNLTFADLVEIARRTGVENWTDPATGKKGAVIAAPSSHRGEIGKMGSVEGVTRHHTGTAETFKPAEDYPTYEVVKEGRAGLENSLSAFGLGRWWGIYVFSEYLSWHAGEWLYAGITDGNGHFLGTEAEGTGARWTLFQQEFYPRLTASELLFIGEGVDMMPRHADGAMPRGRKNDAANLPADFTAKVQGYLDHPETLWYGMPTPEVSEEDDVLKLYRQKGTTTVYLASPGRFVGVNPDFMGSLVVADMMPAKWQDEVKDLPTSAHLEWTRWLFEGFLAPWAKEFDEVDAAMKKLQDQIAAEATA